MCKGNGNAYNTGNTDLDERINIKYFSHQSPTELSIGGGANRDSRHRGTHNGDDRELDRPGFDQVLCITKLAMRLECALVNVSAQRNYQDRRKMRWICYSATVLFSIDTSSVSFRAPFKPDELMNWLH
jgi:hypothetical protein